MSLRKRLTLHSVHVLTGPIVELNRRLTVSVDVVEAWGRRQIHLPLRTWLIVDNVASVAGGVRGELVHGVNKVRRRGCTIFYCTKRISNPECILVIALHLGGRLHSCGTFRRAEHHQLMLSLLYLILVYSQIAQASLISILRRLTALYDAYLLELLVVEYLLALLQRQHGRYVRRQAGILLALGQ